MKSKIAMEYWAHDVIASILYLPFGPMSPVRTFNCGWSRGMSVGEIPILLSDYITWYPQYSPNISVYL